MTNKVNKKKKLRLIQDTFYHNINTLRTFGRSLGPFNSRI